MPHRTGSPPAGSKEAPTHHVAIKGAPMPHRTGSPPAGFYKAPTHRIAIEGARCLIKQAHPQLELKGAAVKGGVIGQVRHTQDAQTVACSRKAPLPAH